MLITDILKQNQERYPEKVALVEREPEKEIRRELTWAEFDAIADQVALALADAGIGIGDRVVHLMMNSLEWLPVYFGILRSGAWAVPLNFRFDAATIQRCVDLVDAKAIFFGQEFTERLNTAKDALDRRVSHYIYMGPDHLKPDYAEPFDHFIDPFQNGSPTIDLKPAHTAAIYFTSGTTGQPKGVVLSHDNLAFSCQVEREHHKQTHDDVFLCIPPLYHTGAKMHWFGNLAVGAKTILLKGVKPSWILQVISEEKATIAWLLVPWAHDILTAIESDAIQLDKFFLDQWRLMHIGAQPVPPSLIRQWRKTFPNQSYDTNYGLTEASGPGCLHLGCGNMHKVGAVGLPGHGWQCRIVDDKLNRVNPGQPGELIVKGPGVMQAYYRNPEETEATLKKGWLLTGDIAREDEDGFIYLVDRKKDVVITGGENIFPVEIESFIMEHSAVQDAAVIGLPDERLGEVAVAIIQPKHDSAMSEEDISRFCQDLPRYKRPRRIYFDAIPRNPTGKIEKPKLRKKYTGRVLSQ